MSKCLVCGKELSYVADKCGECSKRELQKKFDKDPELKQCFKEALEEAFSPENRKKMADDITKIMNIFQEVKKRKDEKA